jgi:hypothetical protein
MVVSLVAWPRASWLLYRLLLEAWPLRSGVPALTSPSARGPQHSLAASSSLGQREARGERGRKTPRSRELIAPGSAGRYGCSKVVMPHPAAVIVGPVEAPHGDVARRPVIQGQGVDVSIADPARAHAQHPSLAVDAHVPDAVRVERDQVRPGAGLAGTVAEHGVHLAELDRQCGEQIAASRRLEPRRRWWERAFLHRPAPTTQPTAAPGRITATAHLPQRHPRRDRPRKAAP